MRGAYKGIKATVASNVFKALLAALLSRIAIDFLIQHWYSMFTSDTGGLITGNDAYLKQPFISEYTTKYTGLFVRWDSEWYIYIAQHGYPTVPSFGKWAFSPLYPLLSRALSTIIPPFSSMTSIILAGLIITNIAFFASVYWLYKLTEQLFNSQKIALVSAVFYCFFFGGVYLSAVYPEALFMALAFGAFYYLEKGRFGVAASLGVLAAVTRSDGFLICIVFIVYALQKALHSRNLKNAVKPVATAAAIISSFLVFNLLGLLLVPSMAFPIQLSANALWGVRPILTAQLFSSYFKGYSVSLLCLQAPILYTSTQYSISYSTFITVGLLFIIIIPTTYFVAKAKHIFRSEAKTLPYWAFYGLTSLVLLTQSWALSVFRFSIPMIPMYWVSAKIYGKSKVAGILLFIALAIMLLICTCLFAIGDGLFS